MGTDEERSSGPEKRRRAKGDAKGVFIKAASEAGLFFSAFSSSVLLPFPGADL